MSEFKKYKRGENKLNDLIVAQKGKKLTEGVDYTVSGNIITPINKELFKDADENGEIELTMKYTYKIN